MNFRLLLPALLIPTIICAQTSICGKVFSGNTKKPVADATVSLNEAGSKLIHSYTRTDEKGMYEIRYDGDKDSLIITVSGFNLKKASRIVPNHSQTLDFEVEEVALKIKEVVVKSEKIRQSGDTINYLVSAFKDRTDRSIGDVLKKMPGIQVGDDGTVYYQNMPINKYYIENLDLLQGRYGIANNNIKAGDIASVQVLENHQPVKAMKGIEIPDQASINLKLKDSAKGIVAGNAKIGAGLPFPLLSNELTGMYFSRTMQEMIVYKENKAGQDVTQELKNLYTNQQEQSGVGALLKLQSPSTPAIRQDRYWFNNAHTGSLNDLHKIGKSLTLTTNINYLFDEPEKQSLAVTDYYQPDQSVVTIDERSDSRQTRNKANAEFLLSSNTDRFYLNNTLKLEGEWIRDNGRIERPGDSISQKLNNKAHSISNTFDLVKRLKSDKRYEVHSYLRYESTPQSLAVQPLLYNDLFRIGTQKGDMLQDLDQKNFTTRNKASFGIKGITLNLTFNADIQNLKTGLYGRPEEQIETVTSDSLQNRLKWNRYEWGIGSFGSWFLTSKLHLALGLPLRYELLHSNDRLRNKQSDTGGLYFEPFVNINYKLSPAWSAMLMYLYTKQAGSPFDAYTGYIMATYRNLMKNDGRLYHNDMHNAIVSLDYKNPFTSLFGSVSASYMRNGSDFLNDYVFRGTLRMKSSLEYKNHSDRFSGSLSIGKDLETIHTTASLNMGYTYFKSTELNQGIPSEFKMDAISISPKFTTRFGQVAVLDYRMRYQWNKSKIQALKQDLPVINTLSQNMKSSFFPLKDVQISVSAEHFFNGNITSGDRSIWFGDIGIKYTWRKIDIMLDYTNIFNTKKYITTSYNETYRYYYSYRLRPAEVILKVLFSF